MLNGFAIDKWEMEYPQLLDGCVLRFCPSVTAPTGITLFDLIGSSNGTLLNGPTWTLSGDKYHALSFDGVNDYINVPVTKLPTIQSPKTISFWATYDGTGTRRIMFAISLSGNSVDIEINAAFSLPIVSAVSWGGAAVAQAFLDGTNANIGADKWFHIAYVSTGYAVDNKLFINGRDWTYAPTKTTSAQTGIPTECRLASFNGGFPSPFHNRLLDDFAVWNRALTQSEISLLASERKVMYTPLFPRMFRTFSRCGVDNAVQTINLGRVIETELVRSITVNNPNSIAIGKAIENESVRNLSIVNPNLIALSRIVETELVRSITVNNPNSIAIGKAIENELAKSLIVDNPNSVSLNRVAEIESVKSIVISQGNVVVVGKVSEIETVRSIAITNPDFIPVGKVVESEFARSLSIRIAQAIQLGRITETEVARSVTLFDIKPTNYYYLLMAS